MKQSAKTRREVAMGAQHQNLEVEKLASEVSLVAGDRKTEGIRRALAERKQRLAFQAVQSDRTHELTGFLEREVWAAIRARATGRRALR
jgi:hypothetical protein